MAESNTPPMGTNGEAIPLPPLPLYRIFQIADEQDYGEEDRACITRLCRAIEKEAITPYAERIRQLEAAYDAATSLAGDTINARNAEVAEQADHIRHLERELEQTKAAFIGSENARKDAERARGTVQSIDTPEFRALICNWANSGWGDVAEQRMFETGWNNVIAYIDGRIAGTASEGWKWVPVEPTEAMLKAAVRAFQTNYSSDDTLAD